MADRLNNNKTLWGIDLGGTKIECIVLDAVTKDVITRQRLATEQSKGYKHILSRIKLLIDSIIKDINCKPTLIGFGTPGVLDFESGRLKNSNATCLIGQSIKKDLQEMLDVQVIVANDANCFALAETKLGIVNDLYPDAKVVLGVIMGTGVGAGIVVNGKLVEGRHGIAGEWGHNFLDQNGGKCYCGRQGCVETIISGPALEKYYFNLTSKRKQLFEIVNRQNSEEAARNTISHLVQMFAKAITPVINILDPDIIVLGGGVGNIEQLHSESKPEIKKYIFNNDVHTAIVKPKLGDSAGVFGAALLD